MEFCDYVTVIFQIQSNIIFYLKLFLTIGLVLLRIFIKDSIPTFINLDYIKFLSFINTMLEQSDYSESDLDYDDDFEVR